MAFNKLRKKDGTVLIDLTTDTVITNKLAEGYTAHDKHGNVITGTLKEPKGSTTITTNGTSDVAEYENVVVDVPQPRLFAPTTSIAGNVLTIEDDAKNGAFTTGFDIYVNGVKVSSVNKA